QASRESLPEALALDELHRDVDASGVLADLVDDRDVGVGHPGGRARLAEKALPPFLVLRFRQQLEGDVPPERLVVRAVHDAHPPAPQDADDPEVGDPLGSRWTPDLVRRLSAHRRAMVAWWASRWRNRRGARPWLGGEERRGLARLLHWNQRTKKPRRRSITART